MTNNFKTYILCVLLNFCYVIFEGVTGLIIGSVGLLSDAGHNLGDVLALMLSLFAFRLSRTSAKGKYTFGFRKLSVTISLVNSLLLFAAVILIVVGAISKIIHPNSLNGTVMSVTASVGILVNGLTSWLLLKLNQNDVNNRAAYLHMLADTLVSVGVVVSGLIINFTGWIIIDPLISLVIAVIILIGSVKLLVESFNLSVDAVPEIFEIAEVKSAIESCNGVLLAEHIHLWPISTSEVSLTAHVVVRDIINSETYLSEIKQTLCSMDIKHSTIEIATKAEGIPSSGI